mmetsp:Transcript_18628/g.56252  ORF Transcript_18628/g.56252 Transcript_18628/m.56252 type:complete len:214 (+) Transcript_18628:1780-2421(+)
MMAWALPGSPWMSSLIICTARCTWSCLPCTPIWRIWPSGKSWLTTMWAPEACWRPRMVSPPRPMMRPTMPGGHSTVSDTSPWPGAPTSATRVVIWATACCTRSGEGPVTVTFLLSPGVVWSIWIRVWVEYCRALMVSPCLPMSFPTIVPGTCKVCSSPPGAVTPFEAGAVCWVGACCVSCAAVAAACAIAAAASIGAAAGAAASVLFVASAAV